MKMLLTESKSYKSIIKSFIESNIDEVLLSQLKELDTTKNYNSFYKSAQEIYLENSCNLLDEDCINDFLVSKFESVTGYHATKQLDVNYILNEGLKLISYQEFETISLKRFIKYSTEEVIKLSVKEFEKDINRARLNFSINPDFDAHHYLIYGSEMLLSIANCIDDGICRAELRNNGIPVIYKCSVPIRDICEFDLNNLFQILFLNNFVYYSKEPNNFECYSSFELSTETLKKENIIGYEIPKYKMKDSQDHGMYYYDEKSSINNYEINRFRVGKY